MHTWQVKVIFGQPKEGYSPATFNIPADEPEAAIAKARKEVRKEPYHKKGDVIEIKSVVRLEGRAA